MFFGLWREKLCPTPGRRGEWGDDDDDDLENEDGDCGEKGRSKLGFPPLSKETRLKRLNAHK